MADDERLSEKILESADALQQWQGMQPLVDEMTNVVSEYSDVIDSIGTVYPVVAFAWNIYSSIEKAKQDAAQQQAMVKQMLKAVDGMITRAVAEITRREDRREVDAAVTEAIAVHTGFRDNVLPHAKTYPITGFDTTQLDLLINQATRVIGKLISLIKERAKIGDGAAIMILYRNLHAIVQCKLTMDQWRHGLTRNVVAVAERQMADLIQVWDDVVRGFQLMSDSSFSQGIVRFHAGKRNRPQFTTYRYLYRGEAQPVQGSNMAPVSQAFIQARIAARKQAIPQEVKQWNQHARDIKNRLRELKFDAELPEFPSDPWWWRITNCFTTNLAISVINDPATINSDPQLHLVPEADVSDQLWRIQPSEVTSGSWNISTLVLGRKFCLDVYGDDKRRPHLISASNTSGQQWQITSWADGTWFFTNSYSGPDLLLEGGAVNADGSARLFLNEKQKGSLAQKWGFMGVRVVTEEGGIGELL